MNKPVISIIIPVYNTERYLRECIESVIGQTLKELDIILMDEDCRVDRTIIRGATKYRRIN